MTASPLASIWPYTRETLLRLLRDEEGGLSRGSISKHATKAAPHMSVAVLLLWLAVFTIKALSGAEITYRAAGGTSLSVKTAQQTATLPDLPELPNLPTP